MTRKPSASSAAIAAVSSHGIVQQLEAATLEEIERKRSLGSSKQAAGEHGTAALMAGRTDVFTLSIHAERNFPVRKARSSLDIGLEDGIDDHGYMAVLTYALPRVLDDFAPDLEREFLAVIAPCSNLAEVFSVPV